MSDWRPIETAPKGTDEHGIGPTVLLFVPHGLDAPNMVTIGNYFREMTRDEDGRFVGGKWTGVDADFMPTGWLDPSHWMPLPGPPLPDGKGGGGG